MPHGRPDSHARPATASFIGVLQGGLNRVIGDPQLLKERLWQFDASVQADYGFARGSAAFYHAWNNDYAGYEMLLVADPTSARLLRSRNLNMATPSSHSRPLARHHPLRRRRTDLLNDRA